MLTSNDEIPANFHMISQGVFKSQTSFENATLIYPQKISKSLKYRFCKFSGIICKMQIYLMEIFSKYLLLLKILYTADT
jgi:hypothetical protein